MSNIVERLTENIVERDLRKEGASLLNKWESTGLLEGLNSDNDKTSMSRLLENQAKELLREASTMSSGDVEGFAAVAFPIVRRVFGGLVANKLVSVQPMSLPSGLLFFLDFQKSDSKGGDEAGDSVYGGGRVGAEITGGVDLGATSKINDEKGFYSLNNGYSHPTGAVDVGMLYFVATGTVGNEDWGGDPLGGDEYVSLGDSLVRYDPDLSGSRCAVFRWDAGIAALESAQWEKDNFVGISFTAGTSGRVVRRLTRRDPRNTATNVLVVVAATGSETHAMLSSSYQGTGTTATCPINDKFEASDTLGAVQGNSLWGLEGAGDGTAGGGLKQHKIPEIDIKVDSVSVTAMTKKLKAKWSPELGQDLNAYHNLDAEVELTSILSEQIALEIDREILEDLIKGQTAGELHWSRRPGKFVNRETGSPISTYANESLLGADFTGTVSEWYETLLETVNDVSARIHRKTIRGGANFLVCGPESAAILEMTAGFRASITVDSDGSAGAVKVGQVSKKWDVYVDPYFPRNVILVGRKGGSFLESGYVYAPYVPLQVTPTIFGTEDFVPRKGVMTRYAKKMVRPDMYGIVIIQDMLG